ncbi:hypothetical protein DCE79_08815 [Lysinibacillus sp. 2017]|uniref:acylphosphatase n=1 Tax=unclassified Lysinibacillus TaxID=2636778 RepID=UPI000D528BA6|nr:MULTISPECIES: acylphosphatase [unclassified Lysinibacillus]AWE07469.1 hypothetical protein DCE79_08815 [Lysinibacillus sp. 2017]TGN36632.1 hypothetical protein E4L99_03525 [Lysinibacillus sp. S2017]
MIKNLLVHLYSEDTTSNHYIYTKALELGLKGWIEKRNNQLHISLEGTEKGLYEMIKIIHALPSFENITYSMEEKLLHFSQLTTNIV